ncbi:MAG: alpha/beta fold hydrolase [Anaerolineae bacterium]
MRIKSHLLPFGTIFLLLLAACGSGTSQPAGESQPVAQEPAATVTATPPEASALEQESGAAQDLSQTPEPAPQETGVEPPSEEAAGPNLEPVVEAVTIEAADGLALHATYYGPGGTAPFPGVILLHMLGSNRQVWDEVGFASLLADNGYAVLAVDMRGHGETGSSRDWVQAVDDMQRVWDYFAGRSEVAAEQTAVVGASIGANMALITGVNKPAASGVVLLSPGLDYRRVTTGDKMALYGERPILLVASKEDGYAADSVRTLADLAQGEAELQMYNGAGHGTNMFGPQPDLASLILDWLNRHVRAAD